LRETGVPCLALKPFCSGARDDAKLLQALQNGAATKTPASRRSHPEPHPTPSPQAATLTLDEINPFYFPEPLAPFIAARAHRRSIHLDTVLQHIRSIASHRFPRQQSKKQKSRIKNPPTLLIEGIGGILVPLGNQRRAKAPYNALDLILKLRCQTLVVSRNQLGTLNHTLLTVRAMQDAGIQQLTVVLMDLQKAGSDPSSKSNPQVLADILAPIPILRIPFLGPECCAPEAIFQSTKKLGPLLHGLAQP
jgi:dethiobiotin synthase